MPDVSLDDLARLRFSWPEPLLIDLISECYDGAPADRLTPARVHSRFLRELFDGKIRPAAALRIELVTCCAARGITPEAVEAADHAAFLEMMQIIRTRFRNSPRLCLKALQQLHTALGRLPKRRRAGAVAVRASAGNASTSFASAA